MSKPKTTEIGVIKTYTEALESVLHLNGCQQRTAGWNEGRYGAEDIDFANMEELEQTTYKEVLELTYQLIEELCGEEPDADGSTGKWVNGWIDCRQEILTKAKELK